MKKDKIKEIILNRIEGKLREELDRTLLQEGLMKRFHKIQDDESQKLKEKYPNYHKFIDSVGFKITLEAKGVHNG
ncbi:MAG: hypothetical protein NWE91_00295 [Candidatus Bathyarchaeota archaeon]|nr:hypothetical protein [Candidatus Bathyarchaeota archaeon]